MLGRKISVAQLVGEGILLKCHRCNVLERGFAYCLEVHTYGECMNRVNWKGTL